MHDLLLDLVIGKEKLYCSISAPVHTYLLSGRALLAVSPSYGLFFSLPYIMTAVEIYLRKRKDALS